MKVTKAAVVYHSCSNPSRRRVYELKALQYIQDMGSQRDGKNNGDQ